MATSAQSTCITTGLCGVLSPGIQSLNLVAAPNNGNNLKTKLYNVNNNGRHSNTFSKNLITNTQFLMGNGIQFNNIPDAADHILNRDYSKLFDVNGNKIGHVKLFIPEYYLLGLNSAKVFEPSLEPQMQNEIRQDPTLDPTGKIPNQLIGLRAAQHGDACEMKFYENFKIYLNDKNEEFVVLHGQHLFNLDFTNHKNRGCEKDFVIINLTHLYVMAVEVKSTLGKGKSCESAAKQLKGTKDLIESWFGTEIASQWKFIPMVFCESFEQNQTFCNSCQPHIIQGMYYTYGEVRV